MIMYLDGKTNTSLLPDLLYNIKGSRGQSIGGLSPASIGMFVFDPWMLKMAGITKELYRIDDYASDALPMKLASTELQICACCHSFSCLGWWKEMAYLRLPGILTLHLI